MIAAIANTIVKCGMAFVLAGASFGRPLLIATIATLLAGFGAAYLL